MTAFASALGAALPFGLLLGAMFGPLRLAGVDYSAWYRNPAELSEGNDNSWIGLAKAVALTTARLLLAAVFVFWLVEEVCDIVRQGVPDALLSDILAAATGAAEFALGLLLGAGAVQLILELQWRFGLHKGAGQSRNIRLSRPPSALPRPVQLAPGTGARRLIVCCDGTWNSPAMAHETNVVQLLRAIQPQTDTGTPQISYYHLGVGTGNFVDRLLGGGVGIGLSNSVKACYGFIVDNFREGDEILLFGFSRGAYVVRSVAGLIGLVGLLRRAEMHRFAEVWDYYTLPGSNRPAGALDLLAPQRRQNIEITCVGVWDTVGALGVPSTRLCSNIYAFHQTSLGRHVHYAFQALAMDERRGNFQPAVWVRSHPDQHLEQVWFPGVHSNCGGGYPEHGLSDSTLLWMCSKLHGFGLLDLDFSVIKDAVDRYRAERPAAGKLQDSRSFFWKMIAGPVPRPVGITDVTERIHQTAFDRQAVATTRDPYAGSKRQAWLGTIPTQACESISPFEAAYAFPGPGTGAITQRLVPVNRSLCDRVLSWFVGEA